VALSLQKKTELVGLRLKKFNVPENLIARVVMVNDGSGSMSGLYQSGVMQETVDRSLAVAVRFDDNQSLEQFIFNTSAKKLADATPDTFGTYVQKELIPHFHGGGTVYSRAIEAVINAYDHPDGGSKPGLLGRLFGKKEVAATDPNLPMFVMFNTDGENDYSDVERTAQLIASTRDKNIYWMFLGIGSERFQTLQNLAESEPNVGFAALSDIHNMTDDQLYALLLNEEFCTWIKQFAPASA
jgi:hypothetical protein